MYTICTVEIFGCMWNIKRLISYDTRITKYVSIKLTMKYKFYTYNIVGI